MIPHLLLKFKLSASLNNESDVDELINIANHYYLLEDTMSMNSFRKALALDFNNRNIHERYIICNYHFLDYIDHISFPMLKILL